MVQTNLGRAYHERIRGDRADSSERAIIAYNLALEVLTRAAFPQQWARLQDLLGNAYVERTRGDRESNLERAVAAHEAALDVLTRAGSPKEWATTQNHLGNTYAGRRYGDRMENLERALAAYHSALEVFTRTAFPLEWAVTQQNIAALYIERIQGDRTENLERSIEACEAALEVFTRAASPQNWATVQNNLGVAYRQRMHGDRAKNLKRAITACELALEVRGSATDPLASLNTGRNLARAAILADRWEIAFEGFRTAAEAVERSRTEALDEERRREISEGAVDVYAGLVEACVRTDAPAEALVYADRAKARGLVELLAGRTLTPSGDVPSGLLNDLHVLQQRLPALRRQLAALSAPIEDERSLSALRDQRATLQRELLDSQARLDAVLAEIGLYDAEFRLAQAVPPVGFEDIRRWTAERAAALVEWYFTSNTLYAFVLSPGLELPRVVVYGEAEQKRLTDSIDEYLGSYYAGPETWRLRLSRALDELSTLLKIHELLSDVPTEVKTLVLVPHIYLHLLPLHALPLGDGVLLDRFPHGVQYAPSMIVAQFADRRRRPLFRRLFGVQNPTRDLPFTELEVADLRRHFSPEDEVLKRETADMAALRGSASLGSAHCGHFACHGFFDPAQPLRSGLVLAGEERLTLAEVFELPLDTYRLIVLSACETGLTQPRSLADEYVGLPSGFLFAGARCVVGTLWTVNDLSAAMLMMRFYELLFSGGDPAEASEQLSMARTLGAAQRWLRDATGARLREWLRARVQRLGPSRTEEMVLIEATLRTWRADERPFADPFHWAAFVSVGD